MAELRAKPTQNLISGISIWRAFTRKPLGISRIKDYAFFQRLNLKFQLRRTIIVMDAVTVRH